MLKGGKVVITEPLKVEYQEEDFDDSVVPEGSFLLKAHYSFVSPGTERAIFRGQEGWFRLPGVPGYSCVGEVLKNNGVKGVKEGDLVYTRGSHKQYQFINQMMNYTVLPEGIKEEYAGFARFAAIGATGVRVSHIEFGDDVLVIGAGVIGNFAAQQAKLQGGNVLIMDLDDKRLEDAKKCGIDHTLNSSDPEGLMEKIQAVFNGRKPTTVIDATGIPQVIDQAIDFAAQRGELILLGSPRGEYMTNVAHFEQHIHRFMHLVNVYGAHESWCPFKPMMGVKHSCERNERIALDFIKSGKIAIEPLLTYILDPKECVTVYPELDKNNPAYMGVVFDWTKE